MRTMILAALAASTILPAAPASAGFFLEGLEPYSIRACDPADRSLSDPQVRPPGPPVVIGTPSRYNSGGVEPFHRAPCVDARSGKGQGRQDGAGRKWWETK